MKSIYVGDMLCHQCYQECLHEVLLFKLIAMTYNLL